MDMITKLRISELQLIAASAVITARNLGGPGSGNFGHAGIPGQVGGSMGDGLTPSQDIDQRAWEDSTEPLRKKLKFGDEVAFRNKEGKVFRGYIAGKSPAGGLVVAVGPEKVEVPMSEARMPKGGFKTRGA